MAYRTLVDLLHFPPIFVKFIATKQNEMGLFDFLRKKPKHTVSKSFNWNDSGSYLNRTNPLLKLLDDCADDDNLNTDPRAKLGLYRAMVAAFPFYGKAISLRSDIMGLPEIQFEDPSINNLVNETIENIATRSVYNSNHLSTVGISKLIRSFMTVTLRDGAVFPQILIDDDNLPYGYKILDNDKLTFEELEPMRDNSIDYNLDLVYAGRNGRYKVEKNDLQRSFYFNVDERWPWPKPMAYDAEWFALQLVRLIINRADTHTRLSNPPSITTISMDHRAISDMAIAPGKIQHEIGQFHEQADNVIKKYKQILSGTRTNNRPQDLVIKSPMPLNMNSKMFGEGAPGLSDYVEEMNKYMIQVAMPTNLPLVYLGFDFSAGFGDGRFKIEKELMNIQKSYNQQAFEREFSHFIDLYLTAIGSRHTSNDATWNWNEPSLEDEKLMYEGLKLKEETENIFLNNVDSVGLITSPEAQRQYLEDRGREELLIGIS